MTLASSLHDIAFGLAFDHVRGRNYRKKIDATYSLGYIYKEKASPTTGNTIDSTPLKNYKCYTSTAIASPKKKVEEKKICAPQQE